jgi:hypothetical protein
MFLKPMFIFLSQKYSHFFRMIMRVDTSFHETMGIVCELSLW